MPAPTCGACGVDAVVQWSRRPTDAEFAGILAAEKARREMLSLLADPGNPPTFGPLPIVGDTLTAVFACAAHSIPIAAAGKIHGPSCSAPPICNCAPTDLPTTVAPPNDLPPGWTGNA